MPPPEPDFFTLDEVAKRWGVPLADIERYAKTKILDVCVRLRPMNVEGGDYEIDKSVKVAGGRLLRPKYQERLKTGFYPVHPEDLWELFRDGEVRTDQLKPRAGDDYQHLENNITVKRNELIATRTELERFEKTHGEVIQFDKYRSGEPGRPTAMPFVMEEFRRRAKAGECLSKLSSESKALLKWKEIHHPTRPHLALQQIL